MKNSSDGIQLSVLSSLRESEDEPDQKNPEFSEIKEKTHEKSLSNVNLIEQEINIYAVPGLMEWGEMVSAQSDQADTKKFSDAEKQMRKIMDGVVRYPILDIEFDDHVKNFDKLLGQTSIKSMFGSYEGIYTEHYQKWLQQKISSTVIQEIKGQSDKETETLRNTAAVLIIKQEVESYIKETGSRDSERRFFARMKTPEIVDKITWYAHQECMDALQCIKAVHEALKRQNSWENREAMKMAIQDFNKARASVWLPKFTSWHFILDKLNNLCQELLGRANQKPSLRQVMTLSKKTNDISVTKLLKEEKTEQKHIITPILVQQEDKTAKQEVLQHTKPDWLKRFPRETLFNIFVYLTPEDKIRMGFAAKFFLELIRHNQLWIPHLKPAFAKSFECASLYGYGLAKKLFIQSESARKPLFISNALTFEQAVMIMLGMKYLRTIEYSLDISSKNAFVIVHLLPVDFELAISSELPEDILLYTMTASLAPLSRLRIPADLSASMAHKMGFCLPQGGVIKTPADMPQNTLVALAKAMDLGRILSLDLATPLIVMEAAILALEHGVLSLQADTPLSIVEEIFSKVRRILLPAQLNKKMLELLPRFKGGGVFLHPHMSSETAALVVTALKNSNLVINVYEAMSIDALVIVAGSISASNTLRLPNKMPLNKAVAIAQSCVNILDLGYQMQEEVVQAITQAVGPKCILHFPSCMEQIKVLNAVVKLPKNRRVKLPYSISETFASDIAKVFPSGRILRLPDLVNDKTALAIAKSLSPGCILELDDMVLSLGRLLARTDKYSAVTAAVSALSPGCFVQTAVVIPKWEVIALANNLPIHCGFTFLQGADWDFAIGAAEYIPPECGVLLPDELPKYAAMGIALALKYNCFVKLPKEISLSLAVVIAKNLKNNNKLILNSESSLEIIAAAAGALQAGSMLEFTQPASADAVIAAAEALAPGATIMLPHNLSTEDAVQAVKLLKAKCQLQLSSSIPLNQAIGIVKTLSAWRALVMVAMIQQDAVALTKSLPMGCTLILEGDMPKNTAIAVAKAMPLAVDLKFSTRMPWNIRPDVEKAYEKRDALTRQPLSTSTQENACSEEKRSTNISIARNAAILLRAPISPDGGIVSASGRVNGSGLEPTQKSFQYG